MNLNKMSPLLQLALLYEPYISVEAFEQISGQNITEVEWFLIIQCYEDIEVISQNIPFSYEILSNRFAYIKINKNLITDLSDEKDIFYIELPSVMEYIAIEGAGTVCAPASIYTPESYGVSGRGVLVAVIDSGIDYSHVDFINEDGTTRIVALWDQSIDGDSSQAYLGGTYFTKGEIDEALRQESIIARLELVPSVDILGHGTALTGIAAGNGRGSGGQNRGMAPESDLIIVKMRSRGTTSENFRGPTNADVMRGISFAISRAQKLNKPLSLLMGVGMNQGSHAGVSSLEIFVDQMTLVWPSNITVGTGNEANKERHTSGTVGQRETKKVQISIDSGQKFYLLNCYKNYVDEMSFVVIAPNGEKTDVLQDRITNVAYVFGNTSVLVSISTQPFSARTQEVVILLEGFGGQSVDSGVWTLEIIGEAIVDGRYNIWATVMDFRQRAARFLQPDPFVTLTVPSTARLVTSVGSINGRTSQILNTSGRGYTVDERVKPDVVAPALNVVAPRAGTQGQYTLYSGSSVAGAFMCGAYALLIEYGLKLRPSSYFYGEPLKGLVIKYANRLMQFGSFPNQAYGYGILCVSRVLEALERIYNE